MRRVNSGTAGFHDLSESAAAFVIPMAIRLGDGIGSPVSWRNRKFPFCDPPFKLVELLEGLLQGKRQLGDLRPAKNPLIVINIRLPVTDRRTSNEKAAPSAFRSQCALLGRNAQGSSSRLSFLD